MANEKQWKTSPISKVAPESPSEHRLTGEVWLLNLDMIESNTGRVIEKVFESDSNLLSVAPFDEGNVLYSKLRPYLNKVVIPDSKGYATTELIPLRPNQEILNNEFLSYLLRSNEFVSYANSISSGTKMPRMPLADLRKFECILPPMDLQQRFVSFAHQADKSEFDGIKSQFIEMFGRTENTKPLSDFIEVSFPGEWGQEDKDGNGVKVIRTTNFTNTGKLNLADVVTRDIDPNKVEKKKLKKGDIILERSGGTNDNPVGRVVYFNEDGLYLFNNFTQLLRCKEEVNSLFIFYSLFNYYQMNKRIIRSMGNKTTGIQNLKMDQYWQIPIADVPVERQNEFEAIYRQADKSEFRISQIDRIN